MHCFHLRWADSIADEGLAIPQHDGVKEDHPADTLCGLHRQQLQPHSRDRMPHHHSTLDGLLLHELQAQLILVSDSPSSLEP